MNGTPGQKSLLLKEVEFAQLKDHTIEKRSKTKLQDKLIVEREAQI